MPPRSIATASITFGLVSIPVRLFPATSSKAISFNLLHAKDNSRIQQKIYCPVDDAIIDRSELVRGYEIEKGRYVTFTDQELKNLEARGDHAIEISEFIPIEEVDPVFFTAHRVARDRDLPGVVHGFGQQTIGARRGWFASKQKRALKKYRVDFIDRNEFADLDGVIAARFEVL